MSQFFMSGVWSIGVSASASVLSKNIQDWFPLGLTGWVSLESKGLSRVFSNTTIQKHQIFRVQFSLLSNSHIIPDYWKNHSFVGKIIFLLFNMLSRLVIAFLPRNKYLLISWVQSPSTVILDPMKILMKSVTTSISSSGPSFSVFLWSLTSSGNLIEVQILRPHPDLLNQKLWGRIQ